METLLNAAAVALFLGVGGWVFGWRKSRAEARKIESEISNPSVAANTQAMLALQVTIGVLRSELDLVRQEMLDTRGENVQLRQENYALRAEIASLRQDVTRLTIRLEDGPQS